MSDTDPTPDSEAELRDYRETLLLIARHTPTCSPESEAAWSQARWAGLFRDLQRAARAVLHRHGHKP